MAKGQKHSNKEVKKPKKDKTVVAPTGAFLSQAKSNDAAKPK